MAVVSRTATGRVEWVPERALRAGDLDRFWFHDLLHNNPPSTPMGASLYHWPRGTQYAAEWLSFPFSRGFDFALHNGRIYPAPIPITDQAEQQRRLPLFRAKLQDLLDNWPAHYGAFVGEWRAMLTYLKNIDKQSLPLDKLRDVLSEAVRISKRSWEIHFQCMYPSIFAYTRFEELCAQYGISERDMRIMLQGFETKMMEIDRGLWRLASLAQELGLTAEFEHGDDVETLMAALKHTQCSQIWLHEFNHFLQEYGRRTTAALFDPYYKTWIEDPYPVLSTIRTYVLKGGFEYAEHAKKLQKERDLFIAAVLDRLTGPKRQEWATALKHAQDTYWFNEDHNFYVEQWTYSELRFVLLECGRRLSDHGVLAEVDDVFFLTVAELGEILEDILLNAAIGAQMHRWRMAGLVAERRAEWLRLHQVDSEVFVGSVPADRVDDPVFVKIWGLTDDVIRGRARMQQEAIDRVEGLPGAPGEAEGRARVIHDYEGFAQVMPDEVLIAPFTTPAWTPLFSKIKGVCTDSGGMLAHAAICAREYNIPSVVGTITRGKRATQVVRTGDWVRLNGSHGVLEVLHRSD